MKMRFWILFICVFFLLSSGCLSGPLPEEMPNTLAPVTSPPPSVESLNFLSFNTIPDIVVDPEFDALAPEIEGLRRLPFFNPVDVVSNDLQVLNHPRRLQILASIQSRNTYVYVEPKRETDTTIYFTVYKMNDSSTASQVLEAYKSVWNKRALNASGGQIWIWDGYIEEMQAGAAALDKKAVLYWNPESNSSFFSNTVLESHPALTTPSGRLYSVHGETTQGPYFIMIDVKTRPQDIQNKTDLIFREAAISIFKNTTSHLNQTPLRTTAPVNESADLETGRAEVIKENLRTLLESYLAGNISKDEYDRLFQQYEAELGNLTESG